MPGSYQTRNESNRLLGCSLAGLTIAFLALNRDCRARSCLKLKLCRPRPNVRQNTKQIQNKLYRARSKKEL